jgi:hypothetical protein
MLHEYFLRGAAIYCMENQEVVDLLIPVFFPRGNPQVVSPDQMSFIGVQARVRIDFMGETDKTGLVSGVFGLPCVAGKDPFVLWCCEFGKPDLIDKKPVHFDVKAVRPSRTPPPSPQKKRKRTHPGVPAPVVADSSTKREEVGGFAVFTQRLTVTHILGSDKIETSGGSAFKKLLASSFDPSLSTDIHDADRAYVREMFNSLSFSPSS